MTIKSKNKSCRNCKYKNFATQIIDKNEKTMHKETPLPKPPDPDYYYETFWKIKKIPPK